MAYQNTIDWVDCQNDPPKCFQSETTQLFIRQNGIILNKGNKLHMYFYSPDPALNLHSEKYFSMVVSGSLQASVHLKCQIDQLFWSSKENSTGVVLEN